VVEKDDRRDSFSGVAAAIGSGRLTGPVELGAAWGALPDLLGSEPEAPLDEPAWRRPLIVYLTNWAHAEYPLVTQAPAALKIDGLADDVTVDQMLAELGEYPAAAGAVPVGVYPGGESRVTTEPSPSGRMLPRAEWPIERRGPSEWVTRLEQIAPGVTKAGSAALIPRLARRDLLSPLMLWWVLLFALSMVARYDPELWIDALNVNDSVLAVPLEGVLRTAVARVPALVYDALTAPLPEPSVPSEGNQPNGRE
jgi:hypothetical protein